MLSTIVKDTSSNEISSVIQPITLEPMETSPVDVERLTPECSTFSESESIKSSIRDDPDYKVSDYMRKKELGSSNDTDKVSVLRPLNRHFITKGYYQADSQDNYSIFEDYFQG